MVYDNVVKMFLLGTDIIFTATSLIIKFGFCPWPQLCPRLQKLAQIKAVVTKCMQEYFEVSFLIFFFNFSNDVTVRQKSVIIWLFIMDQCYLWRRSFCKEFSLILVPKALYRNSISRIWISKRDEVSLIWPKMKARRMMNLSHGKTLSSVIHF